VLNVFHCLPIPVESCIFCSNEAREEIPLSTLSIISNPASYFNPVFEQQPVPATAQQPVVPAINTQSVEDSVQLSELAQILQMYQQGENATLIASSTGLTVNEVDSDLGISTTASSVPVAVTHGHAAEQSAASAPAAASGSNTTTAATALSVSA
jgi:hypothetical protein